MAPLKNSDDPDTGISYRASPPNIQKLLDKVKARKRAAGEEPNIGSLLMNYRAMLSSKLDQLIEFADIKYGKALLETSWRKVNKPSKLTLRKIRNRYNNPLQRRYEEAEPHIHDVISKLSKVKLSRTLDDLIQFADPRPRNNLGEFSPQQEGGPDPNAMVKTYRVAPAQPGMSPNRQALGGLAGLALVGGAAGTIGSEAVKGAGRGIHALAKKLGYMK